MELDYKQLVAQVRPVMSKRTSALMLKKCTVSKTSSNNLNKKGYLLIFMYRKITYRHPKKPMK